MMGRVTAWRVPLADVVATPEDVAAVVGVLESGWLSMGPETTAFEEGFATLVGAPHAIAMTNGTAALHTLCHAVGLGPGDEVIVPSLTFVAPVFADVVAVDRPYLDAAAVARAITGRTRAILYVDYGGQPGTIRELEALAASRGLLLLEDAAHAAGGWVDGRHLGTIGSGGAFSLFSNKNLAVGEGGVLVTASDEIAARARLFRSHGMTTLTWDRHRGHATTYDVVEHGFNYRIDEMRAALATSRLRRLVAENTGRGVLVARYRELLEDVDGVSWALPAAPGDRSAHHLACVVVDEGVDRDAVRATLAAARIQTSLHYPLVHRFTAFRASSAGVSLPHSEAYTARTITLPLYAHMGADAVSEVVTALAEALDSSLSKGLR